MLAALFYSTFLNYLDRQTLSVAMEPIAREFKLDLVARGNVLSAFIYVYAFSHLFVGFALDRIRNVRWLFATMLVGWSLVTLLVSLARSYHDLLACRALLGVFESVNFPICHMIVVRIFPREQRALASGIFASGAVVATLIAPKLVVFLASQHNWRMPFLVAGGLGLTWLVPWLLVFRHPERRSAGWAHAESERRTPAAAADNSLGSLLRRPAFWIVAGVGVGTVPGSYFASQWLPSYFTQTWKLPFDQAFGNRLMLVYLAQDLGLWFGGAASFWLARRLGRTITARKIVIFAGYLCALPVFTLPLIRSVDLTTAVMCLFVCGLGAWSANTSAFKQEVHPARVATAAALIGAIETGFSAFVVQKVGAVAQRFGGFGAVFLVLGLFLTAAALLVALCFHDPPAPSATGAAENDQPSS